MYNSATMYALAEDFAENELPNLPEHEPCGNRKPKRLEGHEHLYAYCQYCRLMWIMLRNQDWERVATSGAWVGPAQKGEHE